MSDVMEFDGTFDGYQNAAVGTAIYPDQQGQFGLLYTVIGLAGEAGELCNVIQKVMRDTNFIDTNGITKELFDRIIVELGGTLWYMANLCEELGIKLEDVAVLNLEKLYSRKERGTLGGSGDNR